MKVPGNESSRAILLRGAKVPGSEKAKERKGQGANGPRNESSRERIGQGPIDRFAPGSELARERKGCESFLHYIVKELTSGRVEHMLVAF